jgi:hypothetical protein
MYFNFENLDEVIRQHMLAEFESDLASGKLYISKRLNEVGKERYPELLKETIIQYSPEWLAQQLRAGKFFNLKEQKTTKKGVTSAIIPDTAPTTLAEGEFNRFYIRGVCLRAIEVGADKVEVYRGKEVEQARSQSQAMIGRKINPKELLEDLRNSSDGLDTALGLPPGPNSGLTIRLIE